MCVHYTHSKHSFVAASKHLQAEGRSMGVATAELRVSVTNLSRWALQGVSKINHLDKILRSKKNAVFTGPVDQLKAIQDSLLHFIFELREQGIRVNTFMVMLRVIYLAQVPHEELHIALQLCQALPGCPFVLLSNGHAHVAVPAGQS